MKNLTNLFLIAVLSVVMVSCGSIHPDSPLPVAVSVPIKQTRLSTLTLPIEIDLKPYFQQCENSVPKVFNGNENQCSGVSYSYTFDRNPIKFDGKGDYMYYEIDGKYLLNLNYCPECTYLLNDKGNCISPRIYASCGVKEPMRRVRVGYRTNFDISKQFKLQANTELLKFETLDPCEITVFNYDATSKLRKEVLVVLNDLEKEIDTKIEGIDLRSQVNDVWKTIANPMEIKKYGFLNFNPKELSLSDIQFKNNKALVNLTMSFQPTFTTNKPVVSNTQLPSLTDYRRLKDFDVDIDILASYDSICSNLNRELGGKIIDIQRNNIILDSFSIGNTSNNQISLEINFSGTRKGKLYLLGTPHYDSTSQFITFPDLTFDLATKNLLLKTAKWLFSDKITEKIREVATIDLKPHMRTMKSSINKEINQEIAKNIFLSGSINDLLVRQIYADQQHLLVRFYANGKLNLKM